MKQGIFLAAMILSMVACSSPENESWIEDQELGTYFQEAGVSGAMVLYNLRDSTYLVYNKPRIDKAYSPASTYKIMNSLIALETGVIRNEAEVIPWDGVDRSVQAWNADHNMRTAIRYSVVWFYQELARRIGEERMQEYLDQVGYGNASIGGSIDQFWLTGDLRISPKEQVDFLARLYRDDLPFSSRTMNIVKDILYLEQTDSYTLSGKTGWSQATEPQIGWFVGWVETSDDAYCFATVVDIVSLEDIQARFDVTMRVLGHLGILGEQVSGLNESG